LLIGDRLTVSLCPLLIVDICAVIATLHYNVDVCVVCVVCVVVCFMWCCMYLLMLMLCWCCHFCRQCYGIYVGIDACDHTLWASCANQIQSICCILCYNPIFVCTQLQQVCVWMVKMLHIVLTVNVSTPSLFYHIISYHFIS